MIEKNPYQIEINQSEYNQQNLAKIRACAHHKAIELEFQYTIYFPGGFSAVFVFFSNRNLPHGKLRQGTRPLHRQRLAYFFEGAVSAPGGEKKRGNLFFKRN